MEDLILNIFSMIINFAMLLIFIRFMLQFAGIDERDPFAQPAYKATQIVDLFGRIFPTVGAGRISIAAIVLMFLIRLVFISGVAAYTNIYMTPVKLFFEGAFSLVLDFIRMCRYLIIGSIIVSWIVVLTNSMHPIVEMIIRVADPILAPFRRIMPNLGMLDLSPIAAFFAFYIIEKLIIGVYGQFSPMLG